MSGSSSSVKCDTPARLSFTPHASCNHHHQNHQIISSTYYDNYRHLHHHDPLATSTIVRAFVPQAMLCSGFWSHAKPSSRYNFSPRCDACAVRCGSWAACCVQYPTACPGQLHDVLEYLVNNTYLAGQRHFLCLLFTLVPCPSSI